MGQCRFCHEYVGLGVKYGTRHYAHYRCYLKAGKLLADLHDWQIVHFPALLLHEYGLLDAAEAAQRRINAAVHARSTYRQETRQI